jgi:dephospho-CoA kinase
MLVYGLTGGIGAGKSVVREMFAARGVPTFDADEIGRRLLAQDRALAREVALAFPQCRDAGGGIERSALARCVFADEAARRRLEEILHPAILARFRLEMERLTRPRPVFVILEGALLGDTRTRFPLAGLIVVTAPASLRLARAHQRSGADPASVRARFEAQRPQCEKLARATHWIDNGGSLEETERQCQRVLSEIRRECGGEP